MLWYKLIILCYILVFPVISYSSLSINEIYPAPSGGDYEWVEVTNTSSSPVELNEYHIVDAVGKKISFSPVQLLPSEFAIASSSSILNNTDETLTLMKGNDVIEVVSYAKQFDNITSFARCGTEWKLTTNITKLLSNTAACSSPSPSPTVTPVVTPSSQPEVDTQAGNIEISEFYPYPDTGEDEWVEIKNNNSFPVTLEAWQVDDGESSGGKPHEFSVSIDSDGYEVIEIPGSLLNNGGDTVRLVNGAGVEVYKTTYGQSKKGFSFGKESSGGFCLQQQSKGTINSGCVTPTLAVVKGVTEKTKTDNGLSQSKTTISSTSGGRPKKSGDIKKYQHLPKSNSLPNHTFMYTQLPNQTSPFTLLLLRLMSITVMIATVAVSLLVALKLFRNTNARLHDTTDDGYTLV